LLVLFWLAIAQSTSANTIRVERDGTGDYSVIQDAVDVAASGDTIMIGPGRYDEGKIVTTPGWTEFVRVLVSQEDLTIIGAGAGQTIIGRNEPWNNSLHGTDKGIECGQWWGGQHLVVENIQFENMAHGVVAEPTPDLIIRGCSFAGNKFAVYAYGGNSVSVQNSSFGEMGADGFCILSLSNEQTVVNSSQFSVGVGTVLGIQANGLVEVRGCEVTGGSFAGSFSGNQALTVSDCVFTNQARYGFSLRSNQNTMITDCVLSGQRMAVKISGTSSQTEIHRMTITDVSLVSLGFDAVDEFIMTDCVLARGPEFTVWQYSPCNGADKEWYYLDMQNNDWGTTDADTIASWISTCIATVDYIPYVGMPLAAEGVSWGSVKAMFR